MRVTLHIFDFSLLEFAVQFNAIKIFKFWVMNDTEINTELVQWAIQQENYEMIHYVREQLKIEFFRYSLAPAINFWKMDILDFIIDIFFDEHIHKEITEETRTQIFHLLVCASISENFIIFEKLIIPFFIEKNSFFIENLPIIVSTTTVDLSCFFFKEFNINILLSTNKENAFSKKRLEI